MAVASFASPVASNSFGRFAGTVKYFAMLLVLDLSTGRFTDVQPNPPPCTSTHGGSWLPTRSPTADVV